MASFPHRKKRSVSSHTLHAEHSMNTRRSGEHKGVSTKENARKQKHATHETTIKGVSTRHMANQECGKGRGFSCTRPRGHSGSHYATHPPLTRQNIPGKFKH